MASQNPKKFADLLTHGIYAIKVNTKKDLATIQDELGYAVGRDSGSPITHWRRGYVPTRISEIETLAQVIVKAGNLDSRWLIEFLAASGIHPDALVQKLFPSNVNQREKESNITPLIYKTPLPNRTYPIFVGREEELEILSQWLQSNLVRVISLSGISGIGKTSLAIEAASRNLRQFSDGIVHVSLRELIFFDLKSMALAVLTKLFGPKAEFGEQPTSTLHYYLQNSAILLIFDDLHLMSVDALSHLIAQIRNQLPESGKSKAVMISQVRILDLEAWYYTRYLPIKHGLGFDPFLKLIEHNTRLTKLNIDLSIARQVFDAIYGHPKLLEIAIGKAKQTSWEKVLSYIPYAKDDFLTDQVVRAFNQRLPVDIQIVLRSILVFPTTTCMLEELKAITPHIPNIHFYLEQLVDAHLVDFQPDFSLYSIHQLIIDANSEQVDLEARDSFSFQARIKLANFYIHELQINSHVSGTPTFLLANAIGIVQWCAEKTLYESHIKLVLALAEVLKVKGTYTDAIKMISSALQSAQLLEQESYITSLQFYLGEFSYQVGDYENCARIFKEYIGLSPEASSKRADALHRLSILHAYPRGDWYCQVESARTLEECYGLRQKLGEQVKAAYALNDLGHELFCRGDTQRAEELITKSLDIARQSLRTSVDDMQTWGIILRTTAIYYRDRREFELAKSFYEQSIDTLEQIDNVKELAETYLSYAETNEIHKEFDEAIFALSNAIQLLKRFGPSLTLARVWLYLGEVYTFQNTPEAFDKAEDAYQKGLEATKWLPSSEEDGMLYISKYGLGRIQSRRGNFELALELLQTSLEIRERLGHTDGIPFVLYEMAIVKVHLKQPVHALELLERVITTTSAVTHPRGQAIYQQAQTLKVQVEADLV